MTTSTIQLLRAILDGWWTLMTGWKLPGLNVTPAQLTMFMAVAPLTIKFVKDLLSLGVNNISTASRNNPITYSNGIDHIRGK